ncbi:MAG TPA: hypothetical protein VKT70_16025, partial [Stellaceae bacterium]|nr:hypothetical protein [Stellaceae bacterium]
MHRIDTPSAVAAPPVTKPLGTPGFWISGNPVTGVTPTSGDQDWYNEVQEELVSIVSAGNLTPTKGSMSDAITSLKRQFGGHVTKFTASATLTPDQAGLVLIDATQGALTLTLPPAASLAQLMYRFVKLDGSANQATVQAGAGDALDG